MIGFKTRIDNYHLLLTKSSASLAFQGRKTVCFLVVNSKYSVSSSVFSTSHLKDIFTNLPDNPMAKVREMSTKK